MELTNSKNSNNESGNLNRQIEELKLIREELSSLSRSRCMSLKYENSRIVNNQEYLDFDEHCVNLSSPSKITSLKQGENCHNINCCTGMVDHEYNNFSKHYGSPVIKNQLKKFNDSTEYPKPESKTSSSTSIKSIKFPLKKSASVGLQTSELRIYLDECTRNIPLSVDISSEIEHMKNEIEHKKCQAVRLVKKHMNEAERSVPCLSCQSCHSSPCNHLNIYINSPSSVVTTLPPTITIEMNKDSYKETISAETEKNINTQLKRGELEYTPHNTHEKKKLSYSEIDTNGNSSKTNARKNTTILNNQKQKFKQASKYPNVFYDDAKELTSDLSLKSTDSIFTTDGMDTSNGNVDIENLIHPVVHRNKYTQLILPNYYFQLGVTLFVVWYIFTSVIGEVDINWTLFSTCV